MSATLMGAVMDHGPGRLRLKLGLVGIADNADDFGFALLSMETIALKASCDRRHAMRVVKALELEGWLTVLRRQDAGKGNVYFINLEKLGVVPDARARKSKWHLAFEKRQAQIDKKTGDKMSPDRQATQVGAGKPNGVKGLPQGGEDGGESSDILSPENAEENLFLPENSGDNSQGVQVTFSGGSGDISRVPIWKNRKNHENHKNNTPQPPQAGERLRVLTPAMVARKNGKTAMNQAIRDAPVWTAAVDSVMLACDSRSKGLRAAVERAFEVTMEKAHAAGTPDPPDAIATRMIESRKRYLSQSNRGLLRVTYGMKRFYDEGIWANENLWHWDEQELRMAARARVGT